MVDTAAEDQLLRHIPENQLGAFSGAPVLRSPCLQGKRDTAPGPDGLRQAAWYHAGSPFWNALEAHAYRTLDGARLPQSDRTGAMCFTSKALNEQNYVWLDETRPIALLSVTYKFIATLCKAQALPG